MTNTNFPSITAEIISAPAINNMTIAAVGTNMFSINLNVVLVIRFPATDESPVSSLAPMTTAIQAMPPDSGTSSNDVMYTNGEKPEIDGERAAFRDFVHAHGYAPASRQVLSEWVQSQQEI